MAMDRCGWKSSIASTGMIFSASIYHTPRVVRNAAPEIDSTPQTAGDESSSSLSQRRVSLVTKPTRAPVLSDSTASIVTPESSRSKSPDRNSQHGVWDLDLMDVQQQPENPRPGSSTNLFVVKPPHKDRKTKKKRMEEEVPHNKKISSQAAIGLLKRSGEEAVTYMQGLVGLVKNRPFLWDEIMQELEARGSRIKACELFSFLDKQSEYKLHEQNCVCIIGMLSREGKLGLAREVLEEMKKKKLKLSAVPYTMLIHAYVKHGLVEDACSLFYRMMKDGCEATVVTYTVIIHGYLRQKSKLDHALRLLEVMKESGKKPDEILYNCLVNGLVNSGRLEAAEKILDDMKRDKVSANLVTYTNLIKEYANTGRLQDCRKLFQEMKDKGESPNSWTYNALIQGYGRKGLFKEALELYDEMDGVGCAKDVHTYNIAIAMYGKRGLLEDMERLLDEMDTKGVPPDQVTYNTLLDVYAKKSYFVKAHEILREMTEAGYRPNIWTYNIMLSSARKEQSVAEATQLFENLKSKGVVPNIVTYSAMLSLYGRHGLYTEAAKLWDEMIEAGCIPCIIAYSGLIESYGHHGMYQEALACFQDMRKSGIVPDTKIYTALMDAYGKAGRCREAELLYFEMTKEGFVPDGITYGILVRAFANAGRLREGLKYLKIILEYEEPESYLCQRIISRYKSFYEMHAEESSEEDNDDDEETEMESSEDESNEGEKHQNSSGRRPCSGCCWHLSFKLLRVSPSSSFQETSTEDSVSHTVRLTVVLDHRVFQRERLVCSSDVTQSPDEDCISIGVWNQAFFLELLVDLERFAYELALAESRHETVEVNQLRRRQLPKDLPGIVKFPVLGEGAYEQVVEETTEIKSSPVLLQKFLNKLNASFFAKPNE